MPMLLYGGLAYEGDNW